MARTTFAQTNFTAGEISPRALGRFDMSKYANGAKTLENFLNYQLGGAGFRPGTRFGVEVKNSSLSTRIINFQYSTIQRYQVEIGNQYMRFMTNKAQLLNAGIPVEIATPYLTADIFKLKHAQNADTKYLSHPSYSIYKLQRLSAINFSMTKVQLIWGPFRDTNISTTTIGASSDTGPTTLTASSATFATGHVGALWRVKSGVVLITGYTSSTIVTGIVQSNVDGTAGNLATAAALVTDWAEGAFSDYRGWPSAVTFHEQRLWFSKGDFFYGSSLNGFENFKAGANDDDAVVFEINADEVNDIRWMISDTNALHLGTNGGIFPARSGSTGLPITPTNVTCSRNSQIGVADIAPKALSNFIYYAQANKFQMREIAYSFEVDKFKTPDMTLFSDHIFRDGRGIVDMDHQISPNERIWGVRADGQLAVLTRNPDEQVTGWNRLVAGSDRSGPGKFESICISEVDGEDDEICLITQRNINGATKRYIEYMESEDFDEDWDAVRLDCSLTLDNPIIITGVTQANPGLLTAAAHGLINGDQIKINGIVGMTELNNNIYLVANSTANTFTLTSALGVAIDSSAFGTYYSGGEVRKMVTAISGLDHLEGETVSATVDGGVPATQQTFTVVGGAITLPQKAAVIHVGLPYEGTIRFLKQSDGSVSGTAQGKMRRFYLATLRLYRSLGLKIGTTEENLDTVFFGQINDPYGQPPALFTGDKEKSSDTGWGKDIEIIIRQDQPLPLFLLAAIFRSEVEEK